MQKKKTTQWRKVPLTHSVDKLKQEPDVQEAARYLKKGGLVAFPTETVYGLGADATSDEAVAQIFQAKGRPSDNPLIVHVGSITQVQHWVQEIPPMAKRIMEHFCPGPITLILRHKGSLAAKVTAGLETVGIRIPDHPLALALLQVADIPVAAPSANRSGRPSPTFASHVWQDLEGKMDLLLDGGPAGVGVESTVVDVTREQPILLRPGGTSIEELERVIGPIEIGGEGNQPRSPGMKYRHYAPNATMKLVEGEEEEMVNRIRTLAIEAQQQGKRVGVLATEEHRFSYPDTVTVVQGSRKDAAGIARNLYQALRQFDEEQVDLILAETYPETGLFYSVMNRLRKAAEEKIIGDPRS